MKKYILTDEKKENIIAVSIGDNRGYYESLNFIEVDEEDIEQGWDGQYYFKDRVPIKPNKVIWEDEINQIKKWLTDTDYQRIKQLEAISLNEPLPYSNDIFEIAKEKRERINKLEKLLENEEI